MMPNTVGREMAGQRIAERVRQAELDRQSGPAAEFRAATRRERIRRALVAALRPRRRARTARVPWLA